METTEILPTIWNPDVELLRLPYESEEPTASEYDNLVADIWIGVLLSAILLSSVCCLCACLVYHKFQKWKQLGKSLGF